MLLWSVTAILQLTISTCNVMGWSMNTVEDDWTSGTKVDSYELITILCCLFLEKVCS